VPKRIHVGLLPRLPCRRRWLWTQEGDELRLVARPSPLPRLALQACCLL
jgi:hypothetical protein